MSSEKIFKNGLVSVIVPVYNAEQFIQETIESVLAQTYKNMEIVIVDDCSKDSSEAIIKRMKKFYSNIIYHKFENNHGAAVARNVALNIAQGQYVAFLDSDDLWKPTKIEEQINLMKDKKSSFCYTAIEMMNDIGEVIKSKRNVIELIDYNFLLKNTMIATSSVIIDRIALGDFQMPLRRAGQDYATWLMLLRKGAVACGINEALVKYRIRKHSLSSNKLKSIKQVWEIQTQDEKINKVSAVFHVFCFGYNALKKYLL